MLPAAVLAVRSAWAFRRGVSVAFLSAFLRRYPSMAQSTIVGQENSRVKSPSPSEPQAAAQPAGAASKRAKKSRGLTFERRYHQR